MARITIHDALTQYGQVIGPANKTRNLAIVERYLRAGGTAADASLRAYLRELERQGKRPATIDKERRIIQAFWRALGATAPRVVADFDSVRDSDRPALDSAVMRALWTAAVDGAPLDPYQAALVLLSLTYGPRAAELASLRARDVDVPGERIYWSVKKDGQSRWQWLPPILHSRVAIMWPRASVGHVEAQFGRIWATVFGTEKPRGIAWHSIRRGLVRDLLANGVPEAAIGHFMRWAPGPGGRSSAGAMVALYGRPTETVTVGGRAPVPVKTIGLYQVDQSAWARHPHVNGGI